jgi:hypothetical protein
MIWIMPAEGKDGEIRDPYAASMRVFLSLDRARDKILSGVEGFYFPGGMVNQ